MAVSGKMSGAVIWSAFGILIAGISVMQASATSLRPIDQSALQNTLDMTARELMIPGAMVLLRTPQSEFTISFGTTQLGAATAPRTDTHFRIASNTKTMHPP